MGDDFDAFRAAFLRDMGISVGAYPCSVCNDDHEIVRHEDGSIVAVYMGESSVCGNIALKPEDCVALELNWEKLGRAICKAFGFQCRHADLGVHNAVQIAAYTEQGIPVVLGIHCDPWPFRQALCELAARLRCRFILFAPTADWMDAPCQEILSGAGGGFLSLEATVRLHANGDLHTLRPAQELLAPFAPEARENPESVIGAALLLIHRLDAPGVKQLPTHADFFRMYCSDGWALSKIMSETGCSQGTASNRKSHCERVLKAPLESFRQHGDLIERMERQYRDSRAKRIHRKDLIDDGADR